VLAVSELVSAIAMRGRPAVHLDSDGFHNPRDIRYRQGRDSARGYYEGS
jgi:uridine kinase